MWLFARSYSCWLPVTDGLIAAFIGPMLAILLVSVDSTFLSYPLSVVWTLIVCSLDPCYLVVCSLDSHYLLSRSSHSAYSCCL